MNRRSFTYCSLALAFFAASSPTYAQSRLSQDFNSLALQSAGGELSLPGINVINSEYTVADPQKPLAVSEYEQLLMAPDAANVLLNGISALGLNYTADDMRASLSKLKARNVQASKAFFDSLMLGDALLNEIRRGKLPTTNVVRANPPSQPANSPQLGAPTTGSQFGAPTNSPQIGNTASPMSVASTAAVGPFNLGAIEGTYRFEPYSNAWQEGTLEPIGDFRLKWTNRAGVSWGLTANLQTGVLTKDNGSPYQEQPNGREFIVTRDAMGNVTGFQFQGAFYKKM